MNNAINDKLAKFERDIAIIEKSLNRDIAECSYYMETSMLKQKMNFINAEHKIFMESGSSEDLDMLYEAASRDEGEKQKNIFVKIFEAIKRALTNIKNRIAELFSKIGKPKDPNVRINVESDPGKIMGLYNSAMSKGKSLWAKVISGGDASDEEIASIGKPLKTALAVGGVGIAVGAGVTAVNKFGKSSDDSNKTITSMMKTLESKAKNLPTATVNKLKEIAKQIGDIATMVGKSITDTAKSIFAVLAGKGKKDETGNPAQSDGQTDTL